MDKQRRLLTVIFFFSALILLMLEWFISVSYLKKSYALPLRFFLIAAGTTLIVSAYRTFWKSIPTGSALGCYYLVIIFGLFGYLFFKTFVLLVEIFQFYSSSAFWR